MIRDHELSIEWDDIYFLIGLSCRGAQVNLTRGREDPRTTVDLIRTHYIEGSGSVSNRIPVLQIALRPFMSILWMIMCMEGDKSQHVATKAQFLLALIHCL